MTDADPSPPAPPLPPGTWTIDPSSTVGFVARQFLVHRVRGRFSRFSATITVGEEGTAIAGEAAADSVDTGDPARDQHLRSADFFDVEQWPTLRLVGEVVGPGPGAGTHLVDSDLTIRDVTQPVRFTVQLRPAPDGDPDVVAATARASVDRTAFGLTWTPTIETGGVIVSDRVDIVMSLIARRVSGPQN